MHAILEADRALFHLVNGQWHNRFLDLVLPMMRNANFWLPLYLFILVFALLNIRRCGCFILMTSLTAVLTDFLSSHLVKNWIFRLRPCQDVELAGVVRVLVQYCPRSSSFTSSHATTHFGLATFLFITLYPLVGRWAYLGFLWAFLIVYAQVYVGVHYPLDVTCGALLGVMAGLLTARIYRWICGRLNFENQVA